MTGESQLRWPDREAWAKRRRTIYGDEDIPSEFMRAHDALVPDSLWTAAVAELEALWTALGKHVRGAQAPVVDKLLRARQISYDEAVERIDTPADDARELRREIRYLLKRNTVRVPVSYDRCAKRLPVLAQYPLTIVRRYREACTARIDAAYADWERAVQQTPIDDAAWAKELEQRAKFEDDRQHPERFIHRVG